MFVCLCVCPPVCAVEAEAEELRADTARAGVVRCEQIKLRPPSELIDPKRIAKETSQRGARFALAVSAQMKSSLSPSVFVPVARSSPRGDATRQRTAPIRETRKQKPAPATRARNCPARGLTSGATLSTANQFQYQSSGLVWLHFAPVVCCAASSTNGSPLLLIRDRGAPIGPVSPARSAVSRTRSRLEPTRAVSSRLARPMIGLCKTTAAK